MFQSHKQSGKPREKAGVADRGVTIITSGCSFTGKLYCRGASRIAGKIEGNIISEGVLIIEEGAEVLADVSAKEIIIRGHLFGKVSARERVEFHEKASFKGELATPSLIVHEGAQISGSTSMHAEGTVDVDSKDKDGFDESIVPTLSPISEIVPDEQQVQ